MLGIFLNYSKSVKDPFKVQEGRYDLPRDASSEKVLMSPGGENHVDFFELQQVPLELRQGHQGPTLVASGKASLHAGCEGTLGIHLQSVLGPKTSGDFVPRT